jgi:hypothetical protein
MQLLDFSSPHQVLESSRHVRRRCVHLQVLTFFAPIVSATVAVIVLVNYHQPSVNAGQQKAPSGYWIDYEL